MTRAKNPWMLVAPALFAVAWGGNEFTPLLAMYRKVDGFDQLAVNMLLGAYVLGIIPALLIGGPMSDRFGRRALGIPAPFVGIAGSLLLALWAGSMAGLFIGRVLSGIALGLVMAVGSSWVKELSSPPFDTRSDASTGARRASLSLTAGFALGAAAAAALAQFAPLQTVLPYALNILVSVPAAIVLLRAPETRALTASTSSIITELKIPTALHRRFLFVVLPSAPWVFGCAASGYAILPALVSRIVGEYGIAFSGLLCLICLGCGFAIQPLGKRLDREGTVIALVTGMSVVTVGMVVAAIAAATLSITVVIIAAATLGIGYGLTLVAGLQEIQRIAGPDDLAGLTAVFYSLTYVGFFIPMVLAVASNWATYPWLFIAGAVIAALCVGVMFYGRRHPATSPDVRAAE